MPGERRELSPNSGQMFSECRSRCRRFSQCPRVFQLLQLMAQFAVLSDCLAILRLVTLVVTAEAPRAVGVTELADVRPEGHLHIGKHVVTEHLLCGEVGRA